MDSMERKKKKQRDTLRMYAIAKCVPSKDCLLYTSMDIRHFVMALMLVICCQDIIIEIPLKKQSVILILRKLKWTNLKAQLSVMGRKQVLFQEKHLL